MRIIALANQKGGVAKTTTTVNLGACLAQLGKKVLLIDLDPQGNLSSWLGKHTESLPKSMYDVFLGEAEINDILENSCIEGLEIAPARTDLIGVESTFANETGRDTILKRKLLPMIERYDYIMLDCPPSLGLITINALTATREIFVPVETKILALNGLVTLLNTIQMVRDRLNPILEVTGIIACMFDSRTTLSNEVVQRIRVRFQDKVFNTIIRESTRLAECPISGLPITLYAPGSIGAEDYMNLAREVINGEKPANVLVS
ncbi:MAG TPA: ParA family protein [Candidatus Brocadiia bacterium]|nr:ParA family protein [Planctomycetota bacterium]MDO8093560.1 ParA family protein [Candidatus Brocadiales bacterium]